MELLKLMLSIGPSTPLHEPQGGVQCSVANQGCNVVISASD